MKSRKIQCPACGKAMTLVYAGNDTGETITGKGRSRRRTVRADYGRRPYRMTAICRGPAAAPHGVAIVSRDGRSRAHAVAQIRRLRAVAPPAVDEAK